MPDLAPLQLIPYGGRGDLSPACRVDPLALVADLAVNLSGAGEGRCEAWRIRPVVGAPPVQQRPAGRRRVGEWPLSPAPISGST